MLENINLFKLTFLLQKCNILITRCNILITGGSHANYFRQYTFIRDKLCISRETY